MVPLSMESEETGTTDDLRISIWLNGHLVESKAGNPGLRKLQLVFFWPEKCPLFLENANFANSCPASNLPPHFRVFRYIHGAINSYELGDWAHT